MDIIKTLSEEIGASVAQIEAAVKLLDEGNTVPFIARYRKEVTGSLDDDALRQLADRLEYLRNLEEKRRDVISLIDQQGKLTDELVEKINAAQTVTAVDDIYRPFRPKRKTRASVAREKGLEPLAETIMLQAAEYSPTLDELAAGFISEENGILSAEDAFAGARDIIAEDISDNADLRGGVRRFTLENGLITSQKTKDEDSVYSIYYDFAEKLTTVQPHRILALNRGEREDFLKVSVTVDEDIVLNYLFSKIVTNYKSPAFKQLSAAICDGYTRLLAPAIERDIRNEKTDEAGETSIKAFSVNLRHLLMQAPLKGKTVLGYDPGYRTGCKLAVVDKTGRVLDTAVIYPTKPREDIDGAAKKVSALVKKYNVDVIAIGNGTASGESEMFIADLLRTLNADTKYTIVSEAGASVYSASKLGAEEFPDFDVTERSAVSIARRLQDPLAELVKIDPKSIGVGLYQHDLKPARLDAALTGVVEDCVNAVGVDVNTASYSLLSYIAGINAASAKNIVKYREENGEFKSRKDILKVPRIGAKAYEQCAGFLRVPDSNNVLDSTGVHPESYKAATELLAEFSYTENDVRANKLTELRAKCESYGIKALAEKLGIGAPTLLDIIGELEKPGRDIRDSLPLPKLKDKVLMLEELTPGMTLEGVVRNVVDFGAFVDIGVHQDGLVHISEISDRFIRHPSEVLALGDNVTVKIKSVDIPKKRISLTMKL